MNRLSWDTTAPRRPRRNQATQPRPELGIVEAEADLVRIAWDKRNRIGPF